MSALTPITMKFQRVAFDQAIVTI